MLENCRDFVKLGKRLIVYLPRIFQKPSKISGKISLHSNEGILHRTIKGMAELLLMFDTEELLVDHWWLATNFHTNIEMIQNLWKKIMKYTR